MELRAGLFRELARPRRLRVGYRQKSDSRMLRRQPRAQPADASGADDGNS